MFEEPKYRAEIFKIAGIAFVTPFCKLILNPFIIYRSMNKFEFIYALIVAIVSGIIGLTLIEEGRVIIHYWEKKLWKKN